MRNLSIPILAVMAASLAASGAMAQDSVHLNAIPYDLTVTNPVTNITADGDRLVLTAPAKTDMYSPPNGDPAITSAPRVTFVPQGDFIFSARADAPFGANYDGPGLVLWNGGTYWSKLLFERLDADHSVVSTSFSSPVSDNSYHTHLPGDVHTVWLKILRAGNVVSYYMSRDGKDWQILREVVVDPAKPLSVGFLSQAPLGAPFTATFSDIRFEARTYSNYWQGE